MVVKVKLSGLNIRQSRGKWYVSMRLTGESLLKGWVGSRAALDAQMATPEFLKSYTTAKTRDRRPTYAEGTLGGLVEWFKDSPRWGKLSDASRKDYEKTFLYLEPEFDMMLDGITQNDLYDVRDAAAKAKWPRFADKLVSHLSTMFRSKRVHNPAAAIEKLHTADPNANHEWTPEEVQTALDNAPRWILTPLVLARYQGFRGQTCQALSWRSYIADPVTGKAITLTVRKNKELAWFPCEPETIAHLDGLARTSTFVCTTSEGLPWKDEKSLQGAVSEYLKGLKEKALIRPGCTLHGLRVTFAAGFRRLGIDPSTVSDALGDRSKQMGEHYTRHVEKEAGRLRAWRARNGVQNG